MEGGVQAGPDLWRVIYSQNPSWGLSMEDEIRAVQTEEEDQLPKGPRGSRGK